MPSIPNSLPHSVLTELVFLRREGKHDFEKPYKLQYDPGEGLPRTNCANEPTSGIVIQDIRGEEQKFSLEKQGFSVRKLQSRLSPADFYDDEQVKKVYYNELKDLLKTTLKAKRVEVLEHGIRKRHPQFPISTGEDYEYLQPTSVVHVDFTPEAALESSEQVMHVNPRDYDRIQCLNIWKPLHGPVMDWPLAVCDVRTVDPEIDCIATDVVTRTGFTENFQVYPNANYRWYYLSNQMADEVVLFRQTDTDERLCTGVPHAGFRNPAAPPSERPRESVEARAFVYY